MTDPRAVADVTAGDIEALHRLTRRIPPHIIERGRSYANGRRIRLEGRAGDEILAEIDGTHTYTTLIYLKSAKSSCTCPAENPCKHVAALCQYLLKLSTEQTLFDVPQEALVSTGHRLAVIFTSEGDVEFATVDERNRPVHFSERSRRSLLPAHRALIDGIGYWGQIVSNPGDLYRRLFAAPESAEGVAFYFGREPYPRMFAGVATTDYRLTELDNDVLRQDRFNRNGFDAVAFQVEVLHSPASGELFDEDFFLLEEEGLKKFRVSATLMDGIATGSWPLTSILENAALRQRLPAHYQHLWETRVAAGPQQVLSFYGVVDEKQRLRVEAEMAIGYARDAADFSGGENAPVYTITPSRYSFYEDVYDFGDEDAAFEPVLHKSGAILLRDLTAEEEIFWSTPKKHQIGIGKFKVPKTRYLEYFEKIIPAQKKRGVIVRIHDSIAGVFNAASARIAVKASSGIDWFEGKIEIDGLNAADIKSLIRAYRKKEELAELKGGRWYSVSGSGLAGIMQSLENLGLNADSDGNLRRFSRAELLSLEQEKSANLRTAEGIKTVVAKFRRFAESAPVAIQPPRDFAAELRPYQTDGLAFLMKLVSGGMGGILADDMGLGKTVQSIAAMATVAAQKKAARFIVVCPLAAMGVWEHEIHRFAPSLSIYRSHGTARDVAAAKKAAVVVSSFATFALDADQFAAQRFAIAFVDEAQFAKNHKSRTAAALRKINAQSVICLSGTPVENHLEDLWALMDVVFPGYLGTLKGFKTVFGKKIAPEAIDLLKRKIRPFMLRRTKAQVLPDLPEKSETVVYVPMPPEQAKVYEAARQNAVRHMGSLAKGDSALFEMLRHLMNLRRISCHPYLEDAAPDPMHSGKMQYLDEKLSDLSESASGVLIFSQFTAVLKVVIALFKKRGMDFLYLDGSTTEKKRRELVEKFQAGEKKFFLISLKAGGTALTLTQADTVIHLDPWWNPAVENQASDRAHRIGQKRRVFVYKLVAEKSVEEKVLLLQQKKRALFEALMGESGAMPQISREDIEFILRE